MKMPSFTAEVSLYKTNRHYQMIAPPAGLGGRQAVIPQKNIPWELCHFACTRCHEGWLGFCGPCAACVLAPRNVFEAPVTLKR
jgi:hypothetical protein